MASAKYTEAGKYLRDLRVNAGISSRDRFVKLCGEAASYDHITSVENGRIEPKAKDLQVYYRVTGCDAIALLKIPV